MFYKFKCILHNFGCTLSALLVFFTIFALSFSFTEKVLSGMVSEMSMGILSPYHMLMNWLFRVNGLCIHCSCSNKD